MDNRRTFIGQLFGGAVAGAVLAAKPVLARVRKPERKKTKVRIGDGDITYSERPRSLRIGHYVSDWVREGHVELGHWFVHKYLETTCEDVGNVLLCKGYEYTGYRALQFDSYERGKPPVRESNDPNSIEYQQIVDSSDYAMYGPVYLITLETGEKVELICHNTSMRRFAHDYLSRSKSDKEFVLQVGTRTVGKHRYFVPEIVS